MRPQAHETHLGCGRAFSYQAVEVTGRNRELYRISVKDLVRSTENMPLVIEH